MADEKYFIPEDDPLYEIKEFALLSNNPAAEGIILYLRVQTIVSPTGLEIPQALHFHFPDVETAARVFRQIADRLSDS